MQAITCKMYELKQQTFDVVRTLDHARSRAAAAGERLRVNSRTALPVDDSIPLCSAAVRCVRTCNCERVDVEMMSQCDALRTVGHSVV